MTVGNMDKKSRLIEKSDGFCPKRCTDKKYEYQECFFKTTNVE